VPIGYGPRQLRKWANQSSSKIPSTTSSIRLQKICHKNHVENQHEDKVKVHSSDQPEETRHQLTIIINTSTNPFIKGLDTSIEANQQKFHLGKVTQPQNFIIKKFISTQANLNQSIHNQSRIRLTSPSSQN
jgi:hypothetical protein